MWDRGTSSWRVAYGFITLSNHDKDQAPLHFIRDGTSEDPGMSDGLCDYSCANPEAERLVGMTSETSDGWKRDRRQERGRVVCECDRAKQYELRCPDR